MNPLWEAAEAAALRLQWSALPSGRSAVVAGWTVLACPALPDHPWLSQVHGSGPGLDEALALLAGLGVRRVRLQGPAAPAGFEPQPPQVRLVAPGGGPGAATDLRVEVVGPEAAELVARLAQDGFGGLPDGWALPLGAPGWTQLVAHDGDRPVASAALHVRDGVGWLGGASTLPDVRGRGAQTALVLARLRLAADQGAREVVVKAAPGSASLRNLGRAGFAAAYEVPSWWGPT